jgi:uncharacterized damage-inducible protein DinB
MPKTYLFQISNTPETFIRLVDSIRPDKYDTRLAPDRFSLSEAIAHLADWEQVWLDRITQTIEQPGSTFEGQDIDERAAAHHYADKDIHHELEVFQNRRRDTVDYLLRLAEDDWDLTANHSQKGVMSVRDQAQFILAHDMYHLHQISEYLR